MEANFKQQLTAYAQLFVGMALFGTGTPAAKIVSEAFPMFLGPFLRLGVAALALTPFLIIYRKRLPQISRQNWIKIIVIGGVGIVAFTLFLLNGMQRVNGVVGSIVMSLSPAAMATAAVLFMGDSMGWRKILAVMLAVAGVLVINVSGQSIQSTGWDLILGSVLVFCAVASQTLYSILGKQMIRELSPLVALPLIVWVATLLFAGPGIYQATSFDFSTPSLNAWLALVVWGMGPLAVGTLIWFRGLSQVPASTASGYMSAMPAAALVLSYLWLGDEFHPIHLIGFALVFSSIGLVTWAHRVKEASQEDKQCAADSRSGAMPC
ncbi:Permease of the drug/metabolite transporter (DMT) superfamily [Modicisalibacter ilicicola DSM 19980]|uniref:Permease of the drug/metabolite transporter (DMT) superfamily n=1 Tax=Modicisalibacter ilicicola DSM 19980 TaxID=1121942 RepID=A0A1M5DL18_9GAMM|nr:DMT family transporter [Halomonas ilicicola]SHF67606.1 Permease of the drug/metabolite transporter (DMT) superfamily [Halomonas ilicicola DSM 19980]